MWETGLHRHLNWILENKTNERLGNQDNEACTPSKNERGDWVSYRQRRFVKELQVRGCLRETFPLQTLATVLGERFVEEQER